MYFNAASLKTDYKLDMMVKTRREKLPTASDQSWIQNASFRLVYQLKRIKRKGQMSTRPSTLMLLKVAMWKTKMFCDFT